MKKPIAIFVLLPVFYVAVKACITPIDDPLNEIKFENVTGVFKFHLENKTQLSEYKLTAVLKWDIIGGDDFDGILYKFTDNDADNQYVRKKRMTFPPDDQIYPPNDLCSGFDATIWSRAPNGTSVQCAVPCEGIINETCFHGGICNDLQNNYKSLSRDTRTIELETEFGRTYTLNLIIYKGWLRGSDPSFTIKENTIFCRHELISNHNVSHEVAEDFCEEEQDIAKNIHSSGPPSSFETDSVYRDMFSNRGVVVFRWKDPHDIYTNVSLVSFAVYVKGGKPDKVEVNVEDKEEDGYYRVAVKNVKFGSVLEITLTPQTDCFNCIYGYADKRLYKLSEFNACIGDEYATPFCDVIAKCENYSSDAKTSALCTCPDGYVGNGINTTYGNGNGCIDFDACTTHGASNHTCLPTAICKDVPAPSMEASCACPNGYSGDGRRHGSGCINLALAIGLAVGISLFLILSIAVVFMVHKFKLRRKREIEEKMSRFFTNSDILYTPSMLSKNVIKNGDAIDPSGGAFGGQLELDRNSIELKGIIGRGNFGVVHKAMLKIDDENSVLVAVKMSPENPSESLRTAFLAEISIIASIGSHEKLIGMIGCCTSENQPIYLVSQFMKYGDLLHFLWDAREERNRMSDPIYSLTELSIYEISRQVANGMKHLQEIKVIHGDLAARNILVGEGLTCKISDFGLANDVYRYGMIKDSKEKTVPLKWVSPERMMAGKVPITWRSDVWSFGILLYETITLGASPYPEIDRDDLFDKLKSGYRMQKPESCTQYLYDVMLQCWEWTPSKRPTFKALEEKMNPPTVQKNETYVNLVTMVPNLESQNSMNQNGDVLL